MCPRRDPFRLRLSSRRTRGRPDRIRGALVMATRKLAVLSLLAAMMVLLAGCNNDFLQPGFDAGQTKFSSETGVTASNVGTLHRLWVANVQGGASSHSTP